MNISPQYFAILALLTTSFLVRIAPTFIRLQLDPSQKKLVDQVLPMAVFVNFVVYIIWTEIHISIISAVVSILIVFVFSVFSRVGIIITTCASTIIYMTMETIKSI